MSAQPPVKVGDCFVTRLPVVIRTLHRTLLARSCAAFLIVLAASPVTAPFTVFELSDFGRSQPVDTPNHPGHEIAEAQVKIAPHLVVTSPDIAPVFLAVRHEAAVRAIHRLDVPIEGRTHIAVLRV
jgi:hypothetical protein